MESFESILCRTIERSPLELLALSKDIAPGEELDPIEEIEIEVEVTYEPGYFTPGRLSGPPEDCYPDEGADPEIVSVVVLSDVKAECIDLIATLTDHELELLVEEAEEHQGDSLEAAAEAAAEARFESWRDERDEEYY